MNSFLLSGLSFFCLSIAAIAAPLPFSGVVKGGTPSDWTMRGGSVGTGPFGEPVISLTNTDTKGSSTLSYMGFLNPGERKQMKLVYRSNLANSSRDRGAWVFVVWLNKHGQGIKNEYFILKESANWVERTLELSPAPKEANRINIQIRVQERVGTLTLKSVELSDLRVQPEKKVELPLYLRLSATGNFRIAMLNTYGYGLADKAFLKDKLTGTVWSLLDGDGYEFTVNETTAAADRFVLMIDVAGSADQVGAVESNRPQIIAGNGQCRIDGLTGRATVEVFDASGRRVVYETTDKESLACTLHSGNYVVRVRMSNKDYSTKINIR